MAQIEFPSQETPNTDAIKQLHQQLDSMIGIVGCNNFADEMFLRRKDLDMWFHVFIEQIERDGYFTVNGFCDLGNRTTRAESNLRYLNSNFADLDCYKAGLTTGEAIGKTLDRIDKKILPPPSMFARSGRGVWVHWKLHHHKDPGLPVFAYKDKFKLWQLIQNAFNNRLRDLGADRGAIDGARYTRIPGSINTKANERVSYLILTNAQGKPSSYSLYELADFLELERPRRAKLTLVKSDSEKDPVKAAAGKLGWKASVARKLRDWENLARQRNGFRESEPSRNVAAMIGASLYIRAGHSPNDTWEWLNRRNSKLFKPRLNESEISGALRSARKINSSGKAPFSYAYLRDALAISPGEAATLEGEYYREEKATKAERIEARRELITTLLKHTKPTPSTRQLKALLAEFGIHASLGTVTTDLRFLRKSSAADAQNALFSG